MWFRTPHTSTAIGRKQTNTGVHKNTFATQTMFLGQTCGEKSQNKTRKNSVFCASTRKVPHAVWAVFWGKSDSEHPKTQQRDCKIGQTIGSPMRISAVQLVLFTKGMEARIRKKQEERSRLWEPLGSLGEPLGNPLGRLGGGFGETQRAFFLRNMLDFHNNRMKKTVWSPKSSIIPQNGLNLLFDNQKGLCG